MKACGRNRAERGFRCLDMSPKVNFGSSDEDPSILPDSTARILRDFFERWGTETEFYFHSH